MKALKTIGFWLVQCTWGILTTLPGLLVALTMLIIGKKPQRFGPCIYFVIGKDWGGLSMGPIFLCCENAGLHTKQHEVGHSIQNMIWGPLMPFVISIPSVTRYWLRKQPTYLKKTIFVAILLLASLVVITLLIWLEFATVHLHWLTHVLECIRLYCLGIVLWLNIFEVPKYNHKEVTYDEIWFEGEATKLGKKYLN